MEPSISFVIRENAVASRSMPRDRDRRRTRSQGDVDLILAFVLSEMLDSPKPPSSGTATPPAKSGVGTRSEGGRGRTQRNGSSRSSGSS
jgi:hypothetical protein